MQLNRILREGFIAGCIGAAAVAIWFLIVDTVNGRAFFTPAMLGSAVFWGVHDPAKVVIQYSNIIGYTMIHVSAFVVVGCIAAALAAEGEGARATLRRLIVGLCVCESGYQGLGGSRASPARHSAAWRRRAAGAHSDT